MAFSDEITALSKASSGPSAFTIERLIDGSSVATSQQPIGTGQSNQIQVEFGPAENTLTDPVSLLANGTLKINQTGTYRIKISLTYGRNGGSGESELRFRALVNGTQAGQSLGVKIDNARVALPFTDEAWLTLPAGADITYQLMRDSDGNNSGGVFKPLINAGTAASWNQCSCASIRVERWV